MPSKRCATSAKRSGNCSSAPVTNRMACQSRCEIRVQASRRRLLSVCSRRSTPRNRAVWDLACRSAGRLSKRITDDCGRALTCHVALSLASLRRLIRPPHREWSAASGRYGARSMHKTRRWKMTVDVDEGKKAEEQSRFLAQLQATLNVIPAYTWYAAPSGGLTFVNKRTADYLGLPKDHPLRFGIDIGAQWDDHIPLLHPDDHEKSRKSWSTCLRTGEFAEESFRVRNAQGGYRWFRSRVEPLRASDGTLLQWVGVNVDIDELKCAEKGLRESEYKLRQIIETVPSLLWSTDPAGEPTQLSQRLLDYSGMQFEDFLHGGWEAFIHPDDFPETARAFYQAIQTGTSYQAVNRLRRADGEFRWHQTRGEPLRDREGQIVQWYGLSVDIDERKKAEERLRRSESYLAEAQRLSHTGTWFLDARTMRYLYWSDEAYRIWGFDPLQGHPSRENMWQRIHPDDRDRVWEEVQEALRQKRDFSSEFRILLPDGTIKYLEAATYHEFSSSGALAEAVSTHIDVTGRKRAEGALRESEAKIQRLVDSNIIGIFIWDFDGRILEANDEFLRMVGYDREDLLAGSIWWTDLTPPDWRDRNNARIEQQKGGGRFESFEKEFTRKDGSRVPILIGGATFEKGGNQGVAFVLDLSERKRVEAEARENEERYRTAQLELAHANRVATMGQLTASITHEVNQPITAAVTYALAARRFLSAEPPNFHEVDDALSLIVKEGNRAGEVVGRIRALIKKAPARKDAVEINDAVLEVVALTRTEAANNS